MPALLVFLMFTIKIVEELSGFSLSFLGLFPRSWHGLAGIIFAPLLHSDFAHLISNAIPLMVLGASLLYFYESIAYKIFILLYLITGFWVWCFARDAYHIGASGVVYGLATFIFTSGVIRKNKRLMAVALVVTFLYGSLIWGIFPEFFPERNISWESHLMGIIAGAVLAFFFRKEGPDSDKYHWEEDDDDESGDEDDENAYWKKGSTDQTW